MNRYIGKICPFCKTPFQMGDDIVACSQCDMPHHKDCWVENGGCTTFGCLGTIKNVDAKHVDTVTTTTFDYEQAIQPVAQIFCPYCGTQNRADASFCGKCGARLESRANSGRRQEPVQQTPWNVEQNARASFDNRERADLSELLQFVGENQGYYFEKFNEIALLSKKNSWNWCAFFFAPYWCVYRKMYGYGLGMLAVLFVLSLIPGTFTSLLTIGGYVAFGIFGNYVYYKRISALCSRMHTLPDYMKEQFVAKNGGVSAKATVISVLAYAVLCLIANI